MQFWLVQVVQVLMERVYANVSTLALILVPWVAVCIYWLYHSLRSRWRRVSHTKLGPFVTFYDALSSGASAGYDKSLLHVFHPELLREKQIERGLIRAMARYVHHTLGTFNSVDETTACIKQDGLRVNCVALVNFTKQQNVKCQLSWIQRLPAANKVLCNHTESSSQGNKSQEDNNTQTVEQRSNNSSSSCSKCEANKNMELDKWFAIDESGKAPLHTFHITGFHVTPPSLAEECDILPFIDLNDFEPVAERFVELLFAHPPTEAVEMMISSLRDVYKDNSAEGVTKLEMGVQKVVNACGGLTMTGSSMYDNSGLDCTLIRKRIITKSNSDDEEIISKKAADTRTMKIEPTTSNASTTEEEQQGGHEKKQQKTEQQQEKKLSCMEMVYWVPGKVRNMEVTVCLSFEKLRCCVVRYNLQAEPDRRTQVIHDHDSGENVYVAEDQ